MPVAEITQRFNNAMGVFSEVITRSRQEAQRRYLYRCLELSCLDNIIAMF